MVKCVEAEIKKWKQLMRASIRDDSARRPRRNLKDLRDERLQAVQAPSPQHRDKRLWLWSVLRPWEKVAVHISHLSWKEARHAQAHLVRDHQCHEDRRPHGSRDETNISQNWEGRYLVECPTPEPAKQRASQKTLMIHTSIVTSAAPRLHGHR